MHTHLRACHDRLNVRIILAVTHDATFDVVILSFGEHAEPPELGLRRVFGIEAVVAQQLVRNVPTTVQRGVNHVRAEYFRRALESVGAIVEVRGPDGECLPAQGAAHEPAADIASGVASSVEPPPPMAADVFATQQAITPARADAVAPAPLAPTPRARGASIGLHDTWVAEHAAALTGPRVEPEVARAPGAATVFAVQDAARAQPQPAPASVRHPEEDAQLALRAPAFPTLREAGANADGSAPRVEAAASSSAAATQLAANAPEIAAAATTALASDRGEPAAAPDREPAQAYGGLSWGEIDLGRFDASPASPAQVAPQHAQPQEHAPLSLALADPPVPSTPPAAVDPLLPPIFDISQSIPMLQPMRAPDAQALAIARRRQAIRSGESGLPDIADDAPQLLADGEAPVAGAPAETETREKGQKPAARTSPAAKPAAPARGRSPAGRSKATRRARPRDTRSFWRTLLEGAAFPVRGHGVQWIAGIGAYSILVGLTAFGASFVPVLGSVVGFVAGSSLLAFCADYHRHCMSGVARGDRTLDKGPRLDPAQLLRRYVLSGLHLSLFLLVSQLLLVSWIVYQGAHAGGNAFQLMRSPVFWLLALGPGSYWPMAVGTAALHDDARGVWHVHVGMRAIFTAPLEYLALALVSALPLGLGWALLLGIGTAADLPGVFFACSAGLPLSLSHGVMGALTGHLLRARPETFQ